MTKRIISTILALALALTISVNAFAAPSIPANTSDGNIVYLDVTPKDAIIPLGSEIYFDKYTVSTYFPLEIYHSTEHYFNTPPNTVCNVHFVSDSPYLHFVVVTIGGVEYEKVGNCTLTSSGQYEYNIFWNNERAVPYTLRIYNQGYSDCYVTALWINY